jgi:adenylate kinase
MNKSHLIILLGRSGSGKGTQAALIKESYEDKDFKHLTTGGNFREFIGGYSRSAHLAREIVNKGGLMPEFLAVWNWASIFIESVKDNTNIILDGAPRRLAEMQSLTSAIDFYQFKTIIIYIDVSRSWAMERLIERGREDDKNSADIESKMNWFDSDVMPVIQWYSEDPNYKFVHVNGERSVQDIADDIKLKLDKYL